MLSSNKRLLEVDIVKMFAILLVIVGHAAYYQIVEPYGGVYYESIMRDSNISDTFFHRLGWIVSDTIYKFHMPLFFILSGALLQHGLRKSAANPLSGGGEI